MAGDEEEELKKQIVSGLGHGAWCGRHVRRGFVCGVVEKKGVRGLYVRTVGRGEQGGWTHERVWVEGAGLERTREGDVIYGEGRWKEEGQLRWLALEGGVMIWRAARTWDEVD